MSKRAITKQVLNFSRTEIQQEITESIAEFENVALRHPAWDWPLPVVVLLRELHKLAAEEPLSVADILEFRRRAVDHIATRRLKGLDEIVWLADTLEQLAGSERVG